MAVLPRQKKQLSVLIVEDDKILSRSFKRALREVSQDITQAESLKSAYKAIDMMTPDVVILDINLPDGSGVDLAEVLSRLLPMPLMLAVSGEATAEQAFLLKSHGVQGYLTKPFSFTDFQSKLNELLNSSPDIEPYISAQVGKNTFKNVSSSVRKTMLEQALALSQGNKTKTAQLLKITRQAVQQMINDFEIDVASFK